jgi:hypothetical protein
MAGIRRRAAVALVTGSLAIAVVAGPAAAARPDTYTWTDTWTVQHDCGVVEATTVVARQHDFFDADGGWIRSLIQFEYAGTFTGPNGTYAVVDHQSGTFTPTTGALSGQGYFLYGAGGVLVMDAGRLVFDLQSGETLQASARVIEIGEESGGDAAVCARLG